ncbi:MAG: ribonuclease III [Bergeyella sp.]|nr:ribonuclease III [Bergeyella sp.]
MNIKRQLQLFLKILKEKELSGEETKKKNQIKKLLGFKTRNIHFYTEAFTLKSPSQKPNYERLEFLGDSVLNTVVSTYLFRNYSQKNEGFLAQMKSKIVSRNTLNGLGEKLKLTDWIIGKENIVLGQNLSGNLFEAFVGAIYLDLGYETCEKIILDKLLTPQMIKKLENKVISYKSLLLEWTQKKKINLSYETWEETNQDKYIVFCTRIWLDKEKVANASASSKKKSEEKAAQRAFYALNKKQNILEIPNITSG